MAKRDIDSLLDDPSMKLQYCGFGDKLPDASTVIHGCIYSVVQNDLIRDYVALDGIWEDLGLYDPSDFETAESTEAPTPTNCPNCGAPLKNGKCEYCGTEVNNALA